MHLRSLKVKRDTRLPFQMLPCRVHIYVYQWLRYVPCRLTSPTAMAMISQAIVPLVLLLLFYASRQYIAYRRIVRTIKYVLLLVLLLTFEIAMHGVTHWTAAIGPASVRSSTTDSSSFHSLCAGSLPVSGGYSTPSTPTLRGQDGTSWLPCVTSAAAAERRPCSSCWSTVATSL